MLVQAVWILIIINAMSYIEAYMRRSQSEN